MCCAAVQQQTKRFKMGSLRWRLNTAEPVEDHCMPDRYTYPGTEVLINLPGYTDPVLWKRAERLAIAARYAELSLNPIEGDFDLGHLQAIHAHLVQDMYTWGGELRDTDTGAGGTLLAHCRPQFIPAEADRIFGAMRDADHLRNRDADSFSRGLAWFWGETTVLHPFRDGNTRSQFVFFNQLVRAAGWVIDWDLIDARVFAHARTMAISRDETGIDALVYPALLASNTIDDDAPRHAAARAVSLHEPRRTRADLDEALHAAIKSRQGVR